MVFIEPIMNYNPQQAAGVVHWTMLLTTQRQSPGCHELVRASGATVLVTITLPRAERDRAFLITFETDGLGQEALPHP